MNRVANRWRTTSGPTTTLSRSRAAKTDESMSRPCVMLLIIASLCLCRRLFRAESSVVDEDADDRDERHHRADRTHDLLPETHTPRDVRIDRKAVPLRMTVA